MAQFQVTRARDTAPFYFDQLLRIRNVDQARTQRFKALESYLQRQQQLADAYATPGRASGYGGILGAPTNPSGNIALGQQLARGRGWTGNQWNALYTLGMRESGWRNTAQNPTSSAYGIGQFLDSTWGSVGGRKTSDPRAQIEYMLRYIAQRYGNPVNAIAFWNRNHWY